MRTAHYLFQALTLIGLILVLLSIAAAILSQAVAGIIGVIGIVTWLIAFAATCVTMDG